MGTCEQALKDFCNSAAGSGQPVIDKFLADTGLMMLPTWATSYRSAVCVAMDRDVASEPGWVNKLRAKQYSDRAIRNKIHYAKNAAMERQQCDKALTARDAVAETISYESDGHPCIPVHRAPTADWVRDVLAAMNVDPAARFISKPYRADADLLDDLKVRFPDIPEAYFIESDPNWREAAGSSMELFRRMKAAETPALVACKVVPFHLQDNGWLVRDEWRSVFTGKNALNYFRYTILPGGGFWYCPPPPVVTAELEEISARALTATLAIDHENTPAVVVRGPFTKQIVERLGKQLFDPRLLERLDADAASMFVQFACGRVMDCRSLALSNGRPDMYCSKTVGYEYPDIAIDRIEQELMRRGLNLDTTLRKAKEFENRGSDFERYPADIEAEFDAIASVPGMEILKVRSAHPNTSALL